MLLANCLSRFPSPSNYLPILIAHNVQHVQLSSAELDIIWGSVECNPVHSTVCHLTLRGWPECQQEVPHIPDISGVCKMNCLSIQVYSSRGQGYSFPPELLKCTLADLHGAHQGINRMQAQAREAVYWLDIDADIANYVCQCTICTKHKASPPAQPMLPWDIPYGPWQEIVADYFTHRGKEHLSISDQFSKYPFLYKVSTKPTQSLCPCLLKLISQDGPPSLLSIDNGQPFASEELAHFLLQHHIEHSTSSCTSQGLMGSLNTKSEPSRPH